MRSFIRSERIIIVEDDRVRSVVIGPRQRLRPAVAVSAALVFAAFCCVGWLLTVVELQRSRSMTGYVQAGADALALQLADARANAEGLAGELRTVRTAVEEARAADGAALARVEAALAALEQASDAQSAGRALRQAVVAARAELQAVTEAGPNGTLGMLSVALDSVPLSAAPVRPVDLASNVAAAAPVSADTHAAAAGLARALAEAEARAERRAAEAEAARQERDTALAKAVEADRRAQAVEVGQVLLLTQLTEQADLRIGAIEAGLKSAGIDVDAVLVELAGEESGQGGPLVAVPELDPEMMAPAVSEALAQLESRFTRQAQLRSLTGVLPLTAPVDGFYISSSYGKRRDPFTKQWARHEGVDLVAPFRTPVMVTAPGTVVAVGWDEGYGRMVDVDHGFGIRTRYGHLDRISVAEGDRLGQGDIVGLLGNTGRSSGNHVHYEVMVDGKPVDPLRFMEKGRHVCEG